MQASRLRDPAPANGKPEQGVGYQSPGGKAFESYPPPGRRGRGRIGREYLMLDSVPAAEVVLCSVVDGSFHGSECCINEGCVGIWFHRVSGWG